MACNKWFYKYHFQERHSIFNGSLLEKRLFVRKKGYMIRKSINIFILLMFWAVLSLVFSAAQEQKNPFDAIQYIARAIRENPIVCLAEGGHCSKTAHDFLKTMLSDKNVQDALDVIIVEFVTARHQELLDDYMEGKDISFNELSKLWRDTTVSSMVQTWDSPLYYGFLQHIRAINKSLSKGKKIRVMGGDPPIKWEEIKSKEDHRIYFRQRNSFPSSLALKQAANQKKRILIIFGGGHLAKVPSNIGGRINKGLTNLIQEELPDGVKSFSFLIPKELKVEDRVQELEKGKMYETKSHWSGDLPAGLLFPMVFQPDGTKAEPYKACKVRDLYDALVYIGELTEWIFHSPEVFQDDEYWAELNRRSMILFNRPMDEKLRRLR